MDPVIVASARKHGIDDDDILHAHHHPIRVFALDDLTMLTACPFCYIMLDDGVKAEGVEEDAVKVADISIHLLDALDGPSTRVDNT